jgi:hypothetical protein
LTYKREFTRDPQSYHIKSRLLKKVKELYGRELPLLEQKGYLDLATCSKNIAASAARR